VNTGTCTTTKQSHCTRWPDFFGFLYIILSREAQKHHILRRSFLCKVHSLCLQQQLESRVIAANCLRSVYSVETDCAGSFAYVVALKLT
jgi:hypothetical protein